MAHTTTYRFIDAAGETWRQWVVFPERRERYTSSACKRMVLKVVRGEYSKTHPVHTITFDDVVIWRLGQKVLL